MPNVCTYGWMDVWMDIIPFGSAAQNQLAPARKRSSGASTMQKILGHGMMMMMMMTMMMMILIIMLENMMMIVCNVADAKE